MQKYFNIPSQLLFYIVMLFLFVAVNLLQKYLDLYISNIILVILIIFTSFLFPRLLTKFKSFIQYKILITFFVLRLLLCLSSPLFEDDYFRYIVEGQMLNQDVNPYKVSPMEFGMIYTLHEDRHYAGDNLYHFINQSGFGSLSAIYPPVIISMFRLIDSPISLGLLFICTEALFLLLLFLYIKKYSPKYYQNMKLICAWYIHPLVLYEGHLNRHYDLWIGLLIVGALVLYNDHKTKVHSVLFALAIHLKGYSIIYLPFFKQSRWRILFIWLSIELCSYLWYPSRFLKKSSLNTFINQWEFNNGPFTYLRIYLERVVALEDALLYTRIIFLLIFITIFLVIYYRWYFRVIKNSSFILMSILFFICSPVANPWYFLMAVPFYINYCDRYNQHYFISLLSFYYLFYIGVNPLESLALITGLAWFILTLSFCKSNKIIKDKFL